MRSFDDGAQTPGRPWQTWIDRQIEEGQAHGAFDELPGHGKPIRDLEKPRDEMWWVRDKLRREGVEYLPPSLAIRKQAAEAEQRAMEAPSEGEVRRIIGEIRKLNRLSVEGPPTTLMPFDVEEIVEIWGCRPRPAQSPCERTPEPAEPVVPQRVRRTIRTRWAQLARATRRVSAVEHRPADVVPQPLIVEDELADRIRELFALPPALEPAGVLLGSGSGCTRRLGRVRSGAQLVRGAWHAQDRDIRLLL